MSLKTSKTEKLFHFSDLSQKELRNLQLKLTNLLNVFDKFCKENNLRYFLTYGTCIGAIRHKGFIPWDDDLDVTMPRDDYEKLFLMWNNDNNRYQLLRPTKDVLTGVHIGQLRDSETTCIYDYAKDYDICQGIKIDITPLDGCPNNALSRFKQRFFCRVYGLMSAQRVPNHGSARIKLLARVVLFLISSKTIRYKLFHFAEKQVKKYKYDDCDKIRCAYNLVLDKSIFGDAKYVVFEGESRPVPQDYDKYLKIHYGNYMKFPPEENRKPVTEVYFLDLYSPCIKYKGIKYCCSK